MFCVFSTTQKEKMHSYLKCTGNKLPYLNTIVITTFFFSLDCPITHRLWASWAVKSQSLIAHTVLFARLETGRSNLFLLKQVYAAKNLDSLLTLPMEETVKKSTVKKYKIICIVSTVCFLLLFYFIVALCQMLNVYSLFICLCYYLNVKF